MCALDVDVWVHRLLQSLRMLRGKHEGGVVVVITGASAGVGRATARAFAKRGASIGLLARGRDGLEATKREVEVLGGRALALPTDVADPDQVEAAAEAVESTLGPIDLWINNAMVSVFGAVKDTSAAEFRRVTEVTYLGYVHGTLSALRRMLPRNRGTIIQVSSALAHRSIPLQSAYCAAKHAIAGFTESLRCELLHDKSLVEVAMVAMPALNTPQFLWSRSHMQRRPQPVPPIFEPELAADAIAWMASRPKKEVSVAGPTVLAITGNKIAPSLLDRYLARTGYDSQQLPVLDDPNRKDNLWDPLPGDWGARGPFSARAKRHSAEWSARKRRSLWMVGVGSLAAFIAIRALVS
jgi:NAD(P)-dependent dehydrogenase (short-subunit alcohol dehydrogenase family)